MPILSTSRPPSTDRVAVVQAFKMIVGDAVTELRALEATVGGDSFPRTYSGYFDDAERFADAVMSIRSAKGIYFIPNEVDPALRARANNRIRRAPKGESTGDTNIVRRRWLLVDCDAVRPSGISSSDAEHEAALHRCGEIWLYCHDELGWGDPIEADSGNGGHLLYSIDKPADDGGWCERMLKYLSGLFSDNVVKVDVSVHNAARIWKVYGTVACKGDSTPDRPHRISRILRAPRELTKGVATWKNA